MRCGIKLVELKNLSTIILIFSISFMYSQSNTQRIDSLKGMVYTASAKEKIVFYNDIAYEYYTINSDSTFYYANKALRASRKLDYKKGLAKAYNNLGHVHRVTESLDSSLYYYNLYLNLQVLLGDSTEIASTFNNIGVLYITQTDYEKALLVLIKAIEIYEAIDNTADCVYPYQNIATTYASLHRHEDALEYFYIALEIVTTNKNKTIEAAIQNNISIIYSNLKEYDKAESCILKSIVLHKEINAYSNLNIVMVNLINLYIETKQYNKALILLKEAIEITKKQNANRSMNRLFGSIGMVYNHQQEYDSALMYLHSALQYDIKQKRKAAIVVDLMLIGSANMGLNNNIEALKYLYRSFKLANEINDYTLIVKTSLKLSRYYKKNKNYKKALEYLERYKQYDDSIYTHESKQHSMEMEAKFASELKEKANLLLKNKLSIELIKRQKHVLKMKIYLIVAITSLTIILLLLFVFIFYRRNTINLRKLNIARIWKLEQDKVITKQQMQSALIQSDARNSLLKVTNNHLLQQAMINSKLAGWLTALKVKVNAESKKIIQSHLAELKVLSFDKNWFDFEKNFTIIYPGVQGDIRKAMPNLSTGDLRVLCFMIMRLDNSEISMITLQSNSSLRSATFRLRNKFKVNSNTELLEKLDGITGGKVLNNT